MEKNQIYSSYWKIPKADYIQIFTESEQPENDLNTLVECIFQTMVKLWDLGVNGGPKTERYIKKAVELTLVNTDVSPKNFENTYKILTDSNFRSKMLVCCNEDKYSDLIRFCRLENFEPESNEFLNDLQPRIQEWFNPLLPYPPINKLK